MSEVTQRNIKVEVKNSGEHTEHKIRTVNVSASKGIKALYCMTDKKIFSYLFAKNKEWTVEQCKKWVTAHTLNIIKTEEQHVDQEVDFVRLAVTLKGDVTEVYKPNSPSFILKKELSPLNEIISSDEHVVTVKELKLFEEDTFSRREVQDDVFSVYGKLKETGVPTLMEYRFTASVFPIDAVKSWVEGNDIQTSDIKEANKMSEKTVEKTQEYDVNDIKQEIIKLDKVKHLVYGVFLVPEKADHDGDIISSDDIEKVAHGFMADYRDIDEMHKEVIDADIVESAIAWDDDLNYHGKKLSKGTWFGAVKVHNDEVWDKISKGEYGGFSVRISGIREPIKEGGET